MTKAITKDLDIEINQSIEIIRENIGTIVEIIKDKNISIHGIDLANSILDSLTGVIEILLLATVPIHDKRHFIKEALSLHCKIQYIN